MRIAASNSLATPVLAVVALMFFHAPAALCQSTLTLSASTSLSVRTVAFVLPHGIEIYESGPSDASSGTVILTVIVRSSQTAQAETPSGWLPITTGGTRMFRVDSLGHMTEVPDSEMERIEQMQRESARRIKKQREEIASDRPHGASSHTNVGDIARKPSPQMSSDVLRCPFWGG